jgi:superfamily II DNA or RNA helicase/HKD family nuclease
MTGDFFWMEPLALDVRFGYLGATAVLAPRQQHPQVVLNGPSESVLRILREELAKCQSFLFSVAFVTPRALALLKQELVDFNGVGRIVTSDYLAFNSPASFAELMNLKQLGIEVRLHQSPAFHPKGYIFEHPNAVTAMVGSSNLTENALVTNHEWNLKVTAARGSDLALQFDRLISEQLSSSVPLTDDWIAEYAASYVAPSARPVRDRPELSPVSTPSDLVPNAMQLDALAAIAAVRGRGAGRAIVISATGTGKTILSALDVREFDAQRLLFVVHREQILDRTIEEYRRVLGGRASDYGKVAGGIRESGARYVFATVQTLSQPHVLAEFTPDAFDYIVLDEAHRSGAITHRRVLDYFTPEFLLGMTATPERTDGFNVFELFDYNVPYEIRLNRALEEDMLCPFHYYGVSDVTLTSGEALTGEADLRAIEIYGQASVAPRGLIFCSRRDEARLLSDALNRRTLRGKPIRAAFLSGADPIPVREKAVDDLEAGALDYLLSVDVFNEGVDIPSVNQIIMLRQTQSAIVFVQQLGRGLRKLPGKECVIVLDFIGNYANNYLIPVALFGDESLNKESLKQHLIAAEEAGVLPGLASVRFDRISQERVLTSIVSARLDSIPNLKNAIETLRNRLGKVPALSDFLRFDSVDPVLLATKDASYPALVERVLRLPSALTPLERKALDLLSHEVMTSKRAHEFVLLRALKDGPLSRRAIADVFAESGLPSDPRHISSAIDTFSLVKHAEADQRRYEHGIVRIGDDAGVGFTPTVADSLEHSADFSAAVDDIIETGLQLVAKRYSDADPFTAGRQYSRKEVTRLLCWPRKWTSTLYGYRVNRDTGSCAIFVTLHKSKDIAASTAYEDQLLDTTTMLWYTRSRRTLTSDEVRAIVDNDVDIHVFVKKDDAEGTDFYYLGDATSHNAEQATMPGADDSPLDVVRMHLRFAQPIDSALFDYFHPVLT